MIGEGGYPYSTGGVSTWTESIVHGLNEIDFNLIHIGDCDNKPQGSLPANTTLLPTISFGEAITRRPFTTPKTHPSIDETLFSLLLCRNPVCSQPSPLLRLLDELISSPTKALHTFLYSEQSWNALLHCYSKSPISSLADYIWTARSILLPVFHLASYAHRIPAADVIHATTTGYAGLLALLTSSIQNSDFMVTEHANYVHERKLQHLLKPESDDDKIPSSFKKPTDAFHLATMRFRFFRQLRLALYQRASCITSLYPKYKNQQIRHGAHPSKCNVIANGVDVTYPTHQRPQGPFRIGFIGRISPEKDLHTLIRAIAVVATTHPNIECWLIGPRTDSSYASTCEALISKLNLREVITLRGEHPSESIFPNLSALVLTSISEGQPFILLEAMAARIPVIATDVGNCAEMIRSAQKNSDDFNSMGIVVPCCDIHAIANAIIQTHASTRQGLDTHSNHLSERYSKTAMLNSFRTLYAKSESE